MTPETVHSIRVRYNECDQVGIVFNANYLVYTDIVATEFFREHIGGYEALTDRGLDFALAEANLRFRRPLHFDEVFDVRASVGSITSRSLTMEFEFTRDGDPIADITISYVCIEKASHAPHPIPEDISDVLEGSQS